jgi:hypothetical protein
MSSAASSAYLTKALPELYRRQYYDKPTVADDAKEMATTSYFKKEEQLRQKMLARKPDQDVLRRAAFKAQKKIHGSPIAVTDGLQYMTLSEAFKAAGLRALNGAEANKRVVALRIGAYSKSLHAWVARLYVKSKVPVTFLLKSDTARKVMAMDPEQYSWNDRILLDVRRRFLFGDGTAIDQLDNGRFWFVDAAYVQQQTHLQNVVSVFLLKSSKNVAPQFEK